MAMLNFFKFIFEGKDFNDKYFDKDGNEIKNILYAFFDIYNNPWFSINDIFGLLGNEDTISAMKRIKQKYLSTNQIQQYENISTDFEKKLIMITEETLISLLNRSYTE